jgi:putative ABC transport system ATP-binding protein
MTTATVLEPPTSLLPTAAPAARAVEATKVYGRGEAQVRALDTVTVDFAPGRFTAIMGPSGSGKSTLMHTLAGLDSLTSGHVFIGAVDLSTLDDKRLTQLRRDRVGFVFQAFNLVPSLSAGENVALPVVLAGGGRRQAVARAAALLDAVGAGDRAGFAPAHLSGGQQQRVAVARALANTPAVVLADEPTGNLDSASARNVMSLFRASADRGQAIVVVTHDPRVAATADRIVSLVDGLVVDDTRLGAARPVEPLIDLGRPS